MVLFSVLVGAGVCQPTYRAGPYIPPVIVTLDGLAVNGNAQL